jgi:RNA polymerase sigma-70 factor (ECF subfamily)
VNDWDSFVAEHGVAVFRAAWRVLGHRQDVEDVTQEVFLEAFRLQLRTQPAWHWPALLRRMATFRALDRLRRRRSESPLDDPRIGPLLDEPDGVVERNELADRLRQAVAQLPPREAAVFCLRCYEELSYGEIGESLNISSQAVGVALHKARLKLQAILSEAVKGEEP